MENMIIIMAGLGMIQTLAICLLCLKFARLEWRMTLGEREINELFSINRTAANSEQVPAETRGIQYTWSPERRARYMATMEEKRARRAAKTDAPSDR